MCAAAQSTFFIRSGALAAQGITRCSLHGHAACKLHRPGCSAFKGTLKRHSATSVAQQAHAQAQAHHCVSHGPARPSHQSSICAVLWIEPFQFRAHLRSPWGVVAWAASPSSTTRPYTNCASGSLSKMALMKGCCVAWTPHAQLSVHVAVRSHARRSVSGSWCEKDAGD